MAPRADDQVTRDSYATGCQAQTHTDQCLGAGPWTLPVVHKTGPLPWAEGRGQRAWPSLSEGSEPGDRGWNIPADCEEEEGTVSPGTLGTKFWASTLRVERAFSEPC